MNLRDFRIGWRLLLQQPAYSVVVIGGLAIGFAACFLLFGFVAFCLDYDSGVPDNDRLFTVKQRINVFPRPEWATFGYLPLRDIALASGMVEQASIAREIDKPLRADGRLHAVDLSVVDPAFSELFGVVALEGDLRAALTQPDGMALTKTAARKLFGEAPAIGQRVGVDDNVLQVRALLQHATEKSPMNQRVKASGMGRALNGRNVSDIKLLPLRDAYFDEDLVNSRAGQRHGRRATVFGMAAGGLLILLLAAINYVNLATVRTLRRQREIGLRKLLGASSARLVRQFLSEAVLTAVIAASAGLILAWLLLPVFSDLVNRPLDGMFTPPRCALALVFAIVTGVCAGAYPAWIARYSSPAASLAGRGNSENAAGLWVRRALTVLQFSSAMALTATALAVSWQTWFASHASPGFDTANLIVLALPDNTEGTPTANAFIEQLRRVPGVEAVAAISEAVGRDGRKLVNIITAKDGREVPMEAKYVSPNWFEVHRVRALYGRLFNPAHDPNDTRNLGGVVLNQAAALALGYAVPQEAVGKTLPGGQQINGIAPDIRFQGLRQLTKAVIYGIRPASVLSIRTTAPMADAYGAIEPVWRRSFPNDIMEIGPQEAVLAEGYATDARLTRILACTSVVAIALAAFGIYVLSAYSVQRSRREIVMRKLHGARRIDIALMMGREFSSLVGAGALIGLPLAAVAIERYLASYTDRAPIGFWTLAAALAMAALVALLATTRHTATALRMSPAIALRD
ncbi:MAG: FtsX-like permease family protein [Duganella sp.]